MTPSLHTFVQVAARVAGLFGKLATLIIGFAMTMLGLAMTATIVMLPVGLPIGLLGIGLIVCGLFAPRASMNP
jgi:hypothetical protein